MTPTMAQRRPPRRIISMADMGGGAAPQMVDPTGQQQPLAGQGEAPSSYDPSSGGGGGSVIDSGASGAAGSNQPSFPNPNAPRTTGAQFQPNYQTGDINRMWRDNRTAGDAQGDALSADLRAQQDYYGQLEQGYRGQMNNAYQDLYNNPGYTPDEANQIVRSQQFNGLLAPNSAFDSMNPTDAEYSGMSGNTNSYNDFFNADSVSNLYNIDSNSAQYQRNAAQQGLGKIDSAVNQQAADYNNSLGQQLGLSGDFYNNTSNAINSGTSSVRGTIDPSKLRYDQSVANASRLTDQDVQDMQTQAANTVRNRYAAAKDALSQSAAASGNADALAVAAGRARLEGQSAVDAADAATNARLQSRLAQTGRNMELEQSRIGAEQGYAGLASSNEQQIANRTLGQANTDETMRLGAEQDISNRRMQIAGAVGSARTGAAQYGTNLTTGIESGIGQQAQNTGQYVANMGTNIRQAQDQANVARQQALYNSRVGNQQYKINTQYGQGMGVNQQLSQANQQVANARIGGQQEYRGWLSSQTNTNQAAGQTAAGQRIAQYGTQGQLRNQATQGLSNWEIGNQGNTAFNKSLRTIATLAQAGK